MHDHGLITTPEGLATFVGHLSGCPWLAMDTEFIREKTYFPRLCLIQLATPDHIGCIDPLALPDLGPLQGLLQDPACTKVFHAASQDLEVLFLATGSVPAPVFDTQIAASLLGHGEQVGYAALVQALLGPELDKSQSRTDWSRRPLHTAQVEYALDDVRYLVALYEAMQRELAAQQRLDWLAPEFEALACADRYRPDPASAWRRVSGSRRLRARELAVLRTLAAWREEEARTLDRPRRWVLPDDVLLAIARARPRDTESLRDLRGLPRTIRDAQATAIVAAVNSGLEAPESSWPSWPRSEPLGEAGEAAVDAAMALLREVAHRQRIGPEAIASRKDVVAWMRGEEDALLGQGWRRKIAGSMLRRFFDGGVALRCTDCALSLEPDPDAD
jgi:ribonuclease D